MPVQWRAVHSLEEAPRRRTPEEQKQERLRQKRAYGAAKRRAAKALYRISLPEPRFVLLEGFGFWRLHERLRPL